jgi:uncharacterized protein YutE (UPF0331/DUF86 family)
MTNVALVARKLAVMNEHLRRLATRRPPSAAALRGDDLLQDALSMSVLVVVQEAMDVALHIASDEAWEVGSTYREAFVVLARHGIISEALAGSLGGAAQLRNRIAHGYASIDVERLWNELPAGIAAFEELARAVAAFLQKQPS